jgi:hypothetical protein
VLSAQNHLDREVERMSGAALQGRDLDMDEIPQPGGLMNESSHAVYVVHKSDVGSDRVVAEIKIYHE